MENEILTWAKKYQHHGFSVIPIGPDKKPLIEWKKYQKERADRDQILKWFDKPNPPNIGIVTGKISGVTVVDVEKGGEWKHYPTTATVKTGGGGYHLYYKYAEGVGNSTRIHPLTDIRGDGGYVVAPPSGHISGNNYEWVKQEAFQPFPFEKFGVKLKFKESEWKEKLEGSSQGDRNQSASKVIGGLIKGKKEEDIDSLWPLIVAWNQQNTPPLVESELRTVFNSIKGRELRGQESTLTEEEREIGVRLISEIARDLTDDLTVSYPTGYKIYDDAFMGGFKEGDLVIVSGYTGHGKTQLAQSITYNMVNNGQPCLWFSYEVTVGELWRKFKNMGVQDSFLAYSPAKLANQKIDFVAQKIIEARDAFKTKIVFIDHLGFLANDPSNYDMNLSSNYASQLTVICRRLKSIALSEGIVIVLLAHLKKPAAGSSEPSFHDLKDSSGIAQEADAVLLINRQKQEKGYGDKSEVYTNESVVKIEKNRRTGATKVFKVTMQDGVLLDDDQLLAKF